MKRVFWAFFIIAFLTVSTVFTSTVSASSNNETEIETIIHQYIESIKSNKWDEYVDFFDYESELKENLLSFLKDSKNQSSQEGMHGIQNVKLVSMGLTSNPEFSSKGDYVYDVLLDMKVHKESKFQVNGVSHHIFIFNRTSEGLKIETVYFKGSVDEISQEYDIGTMNYIPIEPTPKSIPANIRLYDTSKKQLKILPLSTYIKDVMPNEIFLHWPTESLKANIIAAKTYAWHNIESPRKPASDYNADVTDKYENYQHYKEGSNNATTNRLVDQLSDVAMLKSMGPFDAQYRAGTSGVIGTKGGNTLSQNGTVVLANQGYTYNNILHYYYTGMIVAKYNPYPHVVQ